MPKLNLNRQDMPRQSPEERIKNFHEVALGYTDELALVEAQRCIPGCKHPCIAGCPVEVDIPDFIRAIREGRMWDAVETMKRTNALPGICGRVCPQETQCEERCTMARLGAPMAIGRLERYVADWERKEPHRPKSENPAKEPTGRRVAVVGSGPASLTAAAELAKLGYRVTILEALHVPGGVLMYGIPEFRLPKEIVQEEIDYVKSLGVEVRCDAVVGKTITVDELLNDEGYEAVFLGTGAGLPSFLVIPGENLNGVYSANEFLTRTNLMKAYLFPQYDTPIRVGAKVAVVGAGNVAMDAARCALRLGAKEVYIVYRRSEEEMPARREEVENAKEEGIIFRLLTNPTRVLGKDGWVTGLECLKMELGEPDESGRRRPVPIPGSEFTIEVDTAVIAIGTTPNPLVPTTTQGLQSTRHGTVVADEATGRTTKPRVWAGGDVVTGAATVISAMGAGKRAAADIDAYLRSDNGEWPPAKGK